jgi:hypothetical protein
MMSRITACVTVIIKLKIPETAHPQERFPTNQSANDQVIPEHDVRRRNHGNDPSFTDRGVDVTDVTRLQQRIPITNTRDRLSHRL